MPAVRNCVCQQYASIILMYTTLVHEDRCTAHLLVIQSMSVLSQCASQL